MNEIETTLETHTPYPALYTDHVIHVMIFGGILIGCIYGILVPLFHPSLEFLARIVCKVNFVLLAVLTVFPAAFMIFASNQ